MGSPDQRDVEVWIYEYKFLAVISFSDLLGTRVLFFNLNFFAALGIELQELQSVINLLESEITGLKMEYTYTCRR